MSFGSRFWGVSLAALATLLLTACDGASVISEDTVDAADDTGRLSLYVTDAPVDSADEVVVAFTGVQVKPEDGEPIAFPACKTDDPPECNAGVRQIDLLKLTGDDSAALFEDAELPAGRYEWIRLEVLTSRTSANDSYIVIDGTPRPLWVPSGDQTGLKLVQGFTIPAGGVASFTIDFDLRKSIANPQGPFLDTYFLRPALRLVDNNLMGHLEGAIAAELIEGACLETESPGLGVVYVFDAEGEETDPVDAVSSTKVDSEDLNGEISYSYRVGFLAAEENGTEYRVELRCEGVVDEEVTSVSLAEDLAVIRPGQTTILNLGFALAPQLRIVNLFSGSAEIEIRNSGDSEPLATVAYKAPTTPLTLVPGLHTFDVVLAGTDTVAATSTALLLEEDSRITLLLYPNGSNEVAVTEIADDISAPAEGLSRIRVAIAEKPLVSLDRAWIYAGITPPFDYLGDIGLGEITDSYEFEATIFSVLFDTDKDGIATNIVFDNLSLSEGQAANLFLFLEESSTIAYLFGQMLVPAGGADFVAEGVVGGD